MDCHTILVVTGETSAEQHAARLIDELIVQNPDASFRFFGSGGPAMGARGVELFQDVAGLAAIGPRAAFSNLGRYLSLFRRLSREALRRKPDLAILVDFPEFNLRLARRLKRLGIPVCYFIGPQVWAWRSSRLRIIQQCVDRMLVIFPFEQEFYREHGVDAVFVGNPSMELREQAGGESPARKEEGIYQVALLPGSRRKEIEQIFPILLDAASRLGSCLDCRFWVLRAPGVGRHTLEDLYQDWQDKVKGSGQKIHLEIHPGPSTELLPHVDCAIIKSGTSTLEALILGVPFVMVYRMSPLSYRILRPLVRTDTYCLANLVAGERIVPEFIQDEATGTALADFLVDLLTTPGRLTEMKQSLRNASEKLGKRDAYSEAARQITQLLTLN